MELIILIIYGSALAFIFMYSLNQLQLVYHYVRRKKVDPIETQLEETKLPFITIQLPIYNEMYVVERLIKSVASFDYPKEYLEIQILDDSTDETSQIIKDYLKNNVPENLSIKHIRRDNRDGYKAGALAEALKTAKGEFIAIFDADFIPRPDFLKRTIKEFVNENIGMVQAKWEHINEKFSVLTQLQAFGLDAHFSVEQGGRNSGGHFINFNGTAGIWRKKTIEDAGGWQSDTLTEDLDLSYRAQLKGWKFVYLESCGAPAELPAEMNALKTQQYRWTKGAAECTRKNLPKLIKSKEVKLNTKVNGVFHLLNSTVFICIVITSLLSIPILVIKHKFPEYQWLYNVAGIFLLGVVCLIIFYYVSYSKKHSIGVKSTIGFIFKFPLFLSVSMGLSLHNGIAAFEGLIGRKSPFVRTPKFNIVNQKDDWKKNKYVSGKIGGLTILEMMLSIYFGFGLVLSFKYADFGLFPFLLMLTFGYAFVSILSVKHAMNW